tara:strand:+ start:300 stop:836 length:537 start_codon:yes stop_codon:yes gene_type:complete
MATPSMQKIEQHLIRFGEIDQHQSNFRPIDMALSRYDRQRFSIIGRPTEAATDAKSLNRIKGFNLVYVRCEPQKGIGLHKHETPEIFIPMSGCWEIGLGDDGESSVSLEPWDVLNVPSNLMHSATNVADEAAFLMVISTDQQGPEIFWDPKIIQEINDSGIRVPTSEIPEGDLRPVGD